MTSDTGTANATASPQKRRTRIAAIGIAAVLTAATLTSVLTPAIAQDATEVPDTTQRQERHEQRKEAFAQALATELGLPTERVAEALRTVREQMEEQHKASRLEKLKERLDAAVAENKLTQEQADAIYAAAENGVFPGPGRQHRRGPGAGGSMGRHENPDR